MCLCAPPVEERRRKLKMGPEDPMSQKFAFDDEFPRDEPRGDEDIGISGSGSGSGSGNSACVAQTLQEIQMEMGNFPEDILLDILEKTCGPVDKYVFETVTRTMSRSKYFNTDEFGNQVSKVLVSKIAFGLEGDAYMDAYKTDTDMLAVFGVEVEQGMHPEEVQKQLDLVILSSYNAEELIHGLSEDREIALMKSYEAKLRAMEEEKASQQIYAPPPPPPAVTETNIDAGLASTLSDLGYEVEEGDTIVICDETNLPANQTDTFTDTMDPPPARALARALEDQFGQRSGFELFNKSSSGLMYPFMECKASNGCFSQTDTDSQVEFMEAQSETLGEIRNEMDLGFDAGFKVMNNLAKSIEIIGAPSMRTLGTGMACFSRTTQACRLLQPVSAEDAFAACFQDGNDAAERVSMEALVA